MSDERITLYESDIITIEYWAAKKMIYHTVHRAVGVKDVPMWKEALNTGSNALKKYGISKWFSDDRKNGPVPQEIIDWGANDFNERTVNNGWKYWAYVVAEDVDAVETYIPLIEMFFEIGVSVKIFATPEKALEWLDSVD